MKYQVHILVRTDNSNPKKLIVEIDHYELPTKEKFPEFTDKIFLPSGLGHSGTYEFLHAESIE